MLYSLLETERESRHSRKAVDQLSPLLRRVLAWGVPFFAAYDQQALLWRQFCQCRSTGPPR